WRLARWRVAPDAARNRLDLVVGERGLATATVDFEQRGENLARQHPPVTHRAREGGELVVALPGRDDLLDGRGGAVGAPAPPGACARGEPRGHRRERRFEERMLDLVGIHAAAHVPGRREEDVAALGSDVEAVADLADTRRKSRHGLEVDVSPP